MIDIHVKFPLLVLSGLHKIIFEKDCHPDINIANKECKIGWIIHTLLNLI